MASEEIAARTSAGGSNGRIILFIGLALGVVAAVLVAVLLSGSDSKEVEVPATRVAVVANQDIPARTRITADMLQVKTFKLEDVDADAYTSVAQLTNRVTATDVKTGEVIVPTAVSATAGEGLTFSVSPGMRAVSISVKEVVTAGGNIAPDNHVDILGNFHIEKGGDVSGVYSQLTGQRPLAPLNAPDDSNLTFTLLQNVRVLAVAQELSDEAKKPTGDKTNIGSVVDQAQPNAKASTVTLEVTPQQAQILAVADLLGTLRLSLRPFGEDAQVDTTPIILLVNN